MEGQVGCNCTEYGDVIISTAGPLWHVMTFPCVIGGYLRNQTKKATYSTLELQPFRHWT